jgi:hypothetical protein
VDKMLSHFITAPFVISKGKKGDYLCNHGQGKPWLAQKRRILRLTPALAHP